MRRRLRVAPLLLLVPAVMLITGTLALLPLMMVPVLILAPALLFGDDDPPSDPPEDGDGGGGGGGSRPPGGRPVAPSGGIPLPDARPGSWRRRGHDRPLHLARRDRRPCPVPVRLPQRSPHPLPGGSGFNTVM